MIAKRIIPCLDVRNGRVVKGKNFVGLSDVDDPAKLGKFYSDCGADELVFYDITASAEGRRLFTEVLTEVARTVFIPLTVGGGINSVDDFDRVLKCGADKVSVNSGAIKDPRLILDAAKRYGSQCVVISADIKRIDGEFRVFAKGGRVDTGLEGISWIKRCVDNGAGEVVVIIAVNNRGDVVNAKVDDDVSSTDGCLRNFAVRAARLSKFSSSTSAPARQMGSITYAFIAQ